MRKQVMSHTELVGRTVEGLRLTSAGDLAVLLLDNNRYALLSADKDYEGDSIVSFLDFDLTDEMRLGDMFDTGIITEAEYDNLNAIEEAEEQKARWARDRKELTRLQALYPQGVPDADEPQSEAPEV